MDPKIKTRIQDAKSYVAAHAPHIVMAASAVVGVVVLRGQVSETKKVRRMLQSDRNANVQNAAVIRECIDQNRAFDYYPGVGVHIYSKDKTIE